VKRKPSSITTDGTQYDDEAREWLQAVDREQRRVGRRLSWAEVLRLAKSLGYRLVAEPRPVKVG
jgi:predicted nucleic acid-binding protein